MWESVGYAKSEQKKHAKNTASRQAEGNVVRTRYKAEELKSSYENTCIHYNGPTQEVIQQKQTTPLADRFREQRIAPENFGSEFARLAAEYDALPNIADTKTAQQHCLYALFDLLRERLIPGGENPQIQTALNILQDELTFVGVQNFENPLESPEDPWEHLNDSPFIRMIAELAHQDAQEQEDARRNNPGAPERSATVEPIRNVPPRENFSAIRLIQALSRHHMEQLSPISGPHLSQDFFGLYAKVKTRLLQEGMLSHYTHNPNLTVLHSTDYLKANQVLGREKLEKSAKVDERETVSKSQVVDTNVFRNTGFVFFFLERMNSSHRDTDFGDYRYTVPLAAQPEILDGAWAILHDMAGQPKSGRSLRHMADRDESSTKRIFERSFKDDIAIDLSQKLREPMQPYLDPAASLFSMLIMFLPTAEQRTLLQTPDRKQHETEIRDHLSGNFLLGTDIIDGIALRITHELMTLRTYNEEEFNVIMNDINVFWEYVFGVVHDVQIMVPHDVLATQYDFIGKSAETGMITRPVRAWVPEMRHVVGLSDDAQHILNLNTGSANNCFFDVMFPLMNMPEIEDADALRYYFAERQRAQQQTPLLANAPVDYQHIQQFADLFHITITVMAEIPSRGTTDTDAGGTDADGTDATGMDTVLIDFIPRNGGSNNHYYIRFLPSSDLNGIGHFTMLR